MSTDLEPAREQYPELLSVARQRLQEAQSLPEVAQIVDYAQAVRVTARKVGLSFEAQNDWAEYKLDAERKAGQMLKAIELSKGGRPPKTGEVASQVSAVTLADLDINRWQSKTWQLIASLPADQYQAYIDGGRAIGKEITEAGAVQLAKQFERERNRPQFGPPSTPLTEMGPFDVLYADPPWRYASEGARLGNRAIENHYPTMSLDDICALQPPAVDDAALFLWATVPKNAEAMEVIQAWGFDYCGGMVWVKDKIGMGSTVRYQHELLLIAKRGDMPVSDPSCRPSSVVMAPRTEHSEKPHVFYEHIETMYPGRRYGEIFARQPRPGWASWGNQL